MTYAERIAAAHAHERIVIAELQARGWMAEQFGQGQIPEDARELLRCYLDEAGEPSLLRWLPDILALRPGRPDVALVDAKHGKGPRYAIELRSLDAADIFTQTNTPVYFVCVDLGVLTPGEVHEHGFAGPTSSRGSGTPYVLVEKCHSRSFDSVFGARMAVAA